MPESVTKIRLFVASPSDVGEERRALTQVVEDLNVSFASDRKLTLELIKWETHVWPGFGEDAQSVINERVGEYDIFLGIFWSRFGKPTGRAQSGTAEEFQRAYDRWQVHRRPSLMIYFRKFPMELDSTESIRQRELVIQFRESLSGLYKEYTDLDDFKRAVHGHLIQELTRFEASLSIKAAPEVPKRAWPRPESSRFTRPEVGRPPTLETDFLDKFFGRKRFISDLSDALAGLRARWEEQQPTGGARVQAIWYHGFGGMGKSWFLRKAVLEAREQLPLAKIALIDWDRPVWRSPLQQSPQTARDLLQVLAYRLAQIYGVKHLDSYWRAVQRTEAAAAERSRLLERFWVHFRNLLEEKEPDDALAAALKQLGFWKEGPARAHFQAIWEYQREEVFARWFELGGGSAQDPEAVITPNQLRFSALQSCARKLAGMAPLILILDTCEVLSLELDRSLRRLLTPLCDGITPLLLLIGSRLAPDAAEPPGTRDLWRANVSDERWRDVPFNEGVRFTVEEITLAASSLKPKVENVDGIAEGVHRLTLGVPLAVRLLFDIHERLEVNLSEVDFEVEVTWHGNLEERVVHTMTDRFLYHLSGRPARADDYRDIIILALLTKKPDHELLSSLWPSGLERLRELALRYSLLAMGDLHATVRSFLRRSWRWENRPSEVARAISYLKESYSRLRPPAEADIPARLERLTQTLNIQAWSYGSGALPQFAPALALSLAFDQQAASLIGLALEIIPGGDSELYKGLKGIEAAVTNAASGIGPALNDNLLAWLSEEKRSGTWSRLEEGSLNLLQGLKWVSSKNYRVGLEHLVKGIVDFDIETTPRRAELGNAFFQIGYALTDVPDALEEAMVAYTHALELVNSDAAHNNLGILLERQEHLEEAEAEYRTAMDLAPRDPLYPQNLARLFSRQGKYSEAEMFYEKALSVDEMYAPAYTAFASLLRRLKRDDEAERKLREAVERAPGEVIYPHTLADFLREKGRFAEAEEWYQRALATAPEYAASHNNLAIIMKAQKRFAEAEEHLLQAANSAEVQPLYAANLAQLFLEQERTSDAEEWFRKALANDPKYAPAVTALGSLLAQQARYVEVEQLFRDSIELAPSQAEFCLSLADLLLEQRRLEESAGFYEKVVQLEPTSSRANFVLALLRRKLDPYANREDRYKEGTSALKEEASPLHQAVIKGREGLLEVLLELGAEIDSATEHGTTPMHLAAGRGHQRLVSKLIALNARCDLADSGGRLPLHAAAMQGRERTCGMILQRHPAQITALTVDGQSALHLAARYGRTAACELLLALPGIQLDATSVDGHTPLHLAALNGHFRECTLLIERGADAAAKSVTERTALHFAAQAGHTDVCVLLLGQLSTEVHAVTNSGRTALALAVEAGHEGAAIVLASHHQAMGRSAGTIH